MRAFGLGEKTALDFPGESPGHPQALEATCGDPSSVTVAYGQGVASTSIQLVSAVNVIANDGIYVAPKLVQGDDRRRRRRVDDLPSATHEVVVEADGRERDAAA